MFFASNLQKLRKRENMSQEALAEKLDVTRQSVSKWESGASYPEMDKLISICKIFNVDMDTLVNGDVDIDSPDKEASINTKDILDKFNTLMKKIVCLFESMSFKEIIEFLVTVFLLVIIIIVGTIPKDIIENLIGTNLLEGITYVGPTLNTLFRLIVDILYSVFAIVIFAYVLKIKYLDRIKIKEDTDKEIVAKVKEKRVEEVEKVIIKDNSSNSNSLTRLLAKIIIYIIKFFVVLFLFAPLICIVVLAVMLGFEVLFVIKGLPLVGILLWTIAGIIISALCFEVPLNFVINHKNNYKRVMITLLISLVIIIIGSIIFAFEFFSITYVNELPKDVKTKEISETLPMTNDFKTIGYYYNDIEYVVDDSLTDVIEVDVTYYDYLINNNIEIEVHNNNLLVYMDSPKKFSFKEALDKVSKDIKNGKIYNYDKINEYKVTIKTSSNNINIIKNNNKEFFNENNS